MSKISILKLHSDKSQRKSSSVNQSSKLAYSKLNIYSFQSVFLKLYDRKTPKRLMADLLKNNLLEGSAMSLVKSLTSIEYILKRLKCTCGDLKLLPKKNLSQVGNVCELWKIRNKAKLEDALSKIIKMRRDL